MSLFGAFDKTKHLDELDDPLVTQEGVLTPATRRARVLANLGVTSTAAELNIMDGVTATAAEINGAADVSSKVVVIADANDYTFLTINSGKTHVIEAITGDIALTLPAVSAGLEYTIVMGGIVAEADDWDFINTDDAPFLGALLWLDLNAGDAADEVKVVLPDGTDDTMAIVNVGVGTRLHVICDGTSWFVSGLVVSDDTPTFSTTA